MTSKRMILWDLWCIASIVGIWPRFIEPKLISTTQLKLKIPNLPKALNGFKIAQFSDLHLQPNTSDAFLNKISQKIRSLSPDLIAFTGDFICYGKMDDQERRIQKFLNTFHAPYGCYAVLGNHDYNGCVSINEKGDYDVVEDSAPLLKAFKRMFSSTTLTKKITEKAKAIPLQHQLLNAIQNTPFTLLHNSSTVIKVKDSGLNICGLGEYMLDKCHPENAFQLYQNDLPGIVLTHNPDSIPLLLNYPGEVILCGHTHGGQVNLPWLWKKFTLLENMNFKKGLHHINNKWAYINRGVGGILQFRWFSPPEILLLTLESS